jgi:proteasome lid subunit RPN8/RPN11
MNQQQQIAAMIDIQRKGWDIVAIYHSHPPGAGGVPSGSDLREWHYPEALQVIAVPDQHGTTITLNAYEIYRGQFRRVVILSSLSPENSA